MMLLYRSNIGLPVIVGERVGVKMDISKFEENTKGVLLLSLCYHENLTKTLVLMSFRFYSYSNGSSGVCGIARNPSMAIDGYLIGIDNYATKWVKEHINLVQINDHSLGKGLFHTKHRSFSSPRLHLYSNCQQFIQTSSTVQ
jgi:hypothetical protein